MVIFILCLLITLLTRTIVTSVSRVRQDENCDSFNPDAFVTKYDMLRVSECNFPFRIKLSRNVYGDQSNILVNIEGPGNTSFIVQMSSLNSSRRIGRFQTLLPHSSLQPILCQEFDPSVMATIRPINSSNVTFQWLGPPTDRGTLTLMGIFIIGKEYWIIKDNGPKLFYQKPKLQKDGCITLYNSSELCKEMECEYRLFYELNDDRKTIKVKMRGAGTKKNVYMGIAITSNVNQYIDDAMGVFCMFTEKGVKARSTNKIQLVIINGPRFDSDNGNFDCSITISLKQLDYVMGMSSYFAYFWGGINPTTGQIILPPAQNIKESFQPIISDGTPRNSCHFKYIPLGHTMNSSTPHFNSSSIFIVIIMCYILPISINVITTSKVRMNYNQFKKVSR